MILESKHGHQNPDTQWLKVLSRCYPIGNRFSAILCWLSIRLFHFSSSILFSSVWFSLVWCDSKIGKCYKKYCFSLSSRINTELCTETSNKSYHYGQQNLLWILLNNCFNLILFWILHCAFHWQCAKTKPDRSWSKLNLRFKLYWQCFCHVMLCFCVCTVS